MSGVGSHSVILRVSLKLTALLFPPLVNRNGVYNPSLPGDSEHSTVVMIMVNSQ